MLAAQLFHQLGTEFGETESLEASARIFQALGDFESEQKELSEFLVQSKKLSPKKSSQRWEVSLALARSQEKLRLDSQASQSYRACAVKGSSVQEECGSRLADLYLRNKDKDQAKYWYYFVAQNKSRKPASSKVSTMSSYLGYARYQWAKISEFQPSFQPMELPETHLKKALNQRLSFFDSLSRSYLPAVDAGGVWGLAALHRLALFASEFADEVDLMSSSSLVDPAQVEKFRQGLSAVSHPLRSKAIATWSQGYSKALSIPILSPVLPEVADALADQKVSFPFRAQGSRPLCKRAGRSLDSSLKPEEQLKRIQDRVAHAIQDVESWSDYGNWMLTQGRFLRAQFAFERVLVLDSKNAVALNNLACTQLAQDGAEDWELAQKSFEYLKQALKIDEFFIPAKHNLAALMNYYRLFSQSKSLWEQVLVKEPSMEVWLGLAIALQGLGDLNRAKDSFKKASEMNLGRLKYWLDYHEVARNWDQGMIGAQACFEKMEKIELTELNGFEKSSIKHLREKCKILKK